jgi:protein O-GlcNAc transferase
MLGQLFSSLRGSQRASRISQYLAQGLELQKRGDLDGAIARYEAALEIVPDHVDALCLAANALKLKGDNAAAADMLRVAAKHAPDRAHVFLLLASVLPLRDARSEAIAALRRALELEPDTPALRLNYKLATWLQDAGEADAARLHYDKAYELSGEDALRLKRVTVVPPVPRSSEHIQEIRARVAREAEELLAHNLRVSSPETDIAHTDFYLAYHGENDRPVRELLARLYLHAYPDLAYVSPQVRALSARREGRIRIGVISKYLASHTIGRLMQGFISHLDRARFELTVFVWTEARDAVAATIRASAEHIVVLGESLQQNRQRIEAGQLDLLFYCDIGMEPMTYFLAFSRLAPVQCVTWGHPVSTALPYMDYFVSSALIEAEGAAPHYSEELVLLPESCAYVCYPRPAQPRAVERSRYGVAADEHIYACPQTLFKLHPDFDGMLGGILRADPKGVALFIDNPPELRPLLMERWRGKLADVLDRIRFVPRCSYEGFLELLAAADVLLDPPHFSGGNSSLEALAVGTPIVTLPGPYAKSRLTLASYKRMGVMDCVAADAPQYVDIAVRLGTDQGYRSDIKRRIAEASPVLFDDGGTVRALEDFFSNAVARARREGPLRGTGAAMVKET